MTPEEIAFVAGIFEGEGYVGGNQKAMQLRVKMCDLDVLERCLNYTQVGSISGPYKGVN